jgi:hypothetical protein
MKPRNANDARLNAGNEPFSVWLIVGLILAALTFLMTADAHGAGQTNETGANWVIDAGK